MAIKEAIITAAGRSAIKRALAAGKPIEFSHAAAGSGNPSSGWDAITTLSAQVVSASITSKKSVGGTATIRANFSSTDFASTFILRELGLFCIDPNDATKKVLYLYGCVSMSVENEEEEVPSFAATGSSVKRTLSFDLLRTGASTVASLVPAPARVIISEYAAKKSEIGWLKQIISIPNGTTYKRTASGLVKLCYDMAASIAGRFSESKLKIENGGTGAETPALALSALGISLEGLGASPAGHTHQNATAALNGFLASADKIKLDGLVSSTWTRGALQCKTINMGGAVIHLFRISTTGTSDVVTFPAAFRYRCAYAAARTATGAKATLTAIGKSSVTFTVAANTLYTGIAIGN